MNFLTKSNSDRWFDIGNFIFLTGVLLIVMYPLYFIVIASFSDPLLVSGGQVFLWPKDITFEGYKGVFQDVQLLTGFRNSVFYVVLGTIINLLLTLPAAYAMSLPHLKGRSVMTFLFIFTMFFQGGLIPTYMIVKDLGMLNTIWALVIPNALSVWNLIIARTFFQSTIPKEMREAATVDGASHTRFFISVVLPVSSALIAVMVLFYGVAHWNSYFNALIYLRDKALFPVQLVLRDILVQNTVEMSLIKDRELIEEKQLLAQSMKYAVIIFVSIPVLVLYPFLQKYFVKGVMIGSLKG
ncbi:carbohydrate ABC transporter permease [Paenibacillus sp. GCM10027626]|uniref:carbohydrate ABC transporter permease n=1 Tax=Paenibacillus sp. GCM10027626 TaxID=3273411 RepID=UPI0036324B1A